MTKRHFVSSIGGVIAIDLTIKSAPLIEGLPDRIILPDVATVGASMIGEAKAFLTTLKFSLFLSMFSLISFSIP